MRGEYTPTPPAPNFPWELPPHARRIPLHFSHVLVHRGTTSACAENTWSAGSALLRSGNYLRMRGEYHHHRHHPGHGVELPPHARRIPLRGPPLFAGCGTTSACAENTLQRMKRLPPLRNYLRMRGEYDPMDIWHTREAELPPHARRIHKDLANKPPQQGTTSACAENTAGRPTCSSLERNYLRMRGEYPK